MRWTDTQIDSMDRSQLVSALQICEQAIRQVENCRNQIAHTQQRMSQVEAEANRIRGGFSAKKLIPICAAVLILGLFFLKFSSAVFLAALVGVGYFFLDKYVLSKKREEKAQTFFQQHYPGLVGSCQQSQQRLDALLTTDEIYNCTLLLPEAYQNSEAVSALAAILQSRRASTMADAFLVYDNQEHNRRMEDMQQQQTAAAQAAAAAQERAAFAAEQTASNTRRMAEAQRAQARSAAAMAEAQRAQARSNAELAAVQSRAAARSDGDSRAAGNRRKCRYCGELIDRDASVCPFCRSENPISMWGWL